MKKLNIRIYSKKSKNSVIYMEERNLEISDKKFNIIKECFKKLEKNPTKISDLFEIDFYLYSQLIVINCYRKYKRFRICIKPDKIEIDEVY